MLMSGLGLEDLLQGLTSAEKLFSAKSEIICLYWTRLVRRVGYLDTGDDAFISGSTARAFPCSSDSRRSDQVVKELIQEPL
jgi:hypothetical protein